MSKAIVVSIAVGLLLTAVLGLQLITFRGPHGRVVCLTTKDQLSLRNTLVIEDSVPKLMLEHPLISMQIAADRVACVGR